MWVKTPRLVAQVTNKLSSLFIEENLKIREQQAQGTTEFLESELSSKKDKVEKFQQEITDFKRRYINELPENRDANLKVLEQLNLQSQKINEAIKGAEDRKVIIQNQLANMTLQSFDTGNDGKGSASMPRPPMVVQMSQLKGHLEELQARYTENHPDIVVTRKENRRSGEEAGGRRQDPGGAPKRKERGSPDRPIQLISRRSVRPN